jgi:hypothetical protein
MSVSTVTLNVGQTTPLTCTPVDSLGDPVPGVDLGSIVWIIQHPPGHLFSIDPSGELKKVTGANIVLTAIHPGSALLQAFYQNGEEVFVANITVTIVALDVASLNITQGAVTSGPIQTPPHHPPLYLQP